MVFVVPYRVQKEPPQLTILPTGKQSPEAFEPLRLECADEWDRGWPQSPEVFEELVDTYLDRLVCFAFRQLGSVQDAEDAVQEVFVRVYANRSKLGGVSSVGAYLFRMVANACTDLLRKRQTRAKVIEELGTMESACDGKNPAEIAEATEQLRRVEKLLSCLPTAQAEVIRLRVFDELRLNEIAEVIGCSVNTVCSRLRYGFRKLRRIAPQRRG